MTQQRIVIYHGKERVALKDASGQTNRGAEI